MPTAAGRGGDAENNILSKLFLYLRKGGRSANNLTFGDFPQMWHFADLLIADRIFLWFAYLKLPQVRKYMLFLITNNALIQIETE